MTTNQTAPCEGEAALLPDPLSHLTGWEAKKIDGRWFVGMKGNLDTIHDGLIEVARHTTDEAAQEIAEWIAAAYNAALSPAPTAPVGVDSQDLVLVPRVAAMVARIIINERKDSYLFGDTLSALEAAINSDALSAFPQPGEGGSGEPFAWAWRWNDGAPEEWFAGVSLPVITASSANEIVEVKPLYDHPASDSRDGVVSDEDAYALGRAALESVKKCLGLHIELTRQTGVTELGRQVAALSIVGGGGALRAQERFVPAGGKPETEGPPL